MATSQITITVQSDFIKLARSLLVAQKEATLSPTPNARRKAEQLKTLFESKLVQYEKQITAIEEANKDKATDAAPFAKLI